MRRRVRHWILAPPTRLASLADLPHKAQKGGGAKEPGFQPPLLWGRSAKPQVSTGRGLSARKLWRTTQEGAPLDTGGSVEVFGFRCNRRPIHAVTTWSVSDVAIAITSQWRRHTCVHLLVAPSLTLRVVMERCCQKTLTHSRGMPTGVIAANLATGQSLTDERYQPRSMRTIPATATQVDR